MVNATRPQCVARTRVPGIRDVEGRRLALESIEERVMETRESSGADVTKPASQFRDYDQARPRVEQFYALNHAQQTLAFVLAKKKQYLSLSRKSMTVWEALDFLNTLVD